MRWLSTLVLAATLLAVGAACGGDGETVEVWFLDRAGNLASEERTVSGDPAEQVAAALAELAAGPEDPELTTAVPAGAEFAVAVDGATATVDVGPGLVGGSPTGGSAAATQLVGPLVWTATAVDGIDAVLLIEGGAPLALPGSGLVFDVPLTRDDLPRGPG